jgi:membrane protein DedA with SNARE-associated domain
VNGWEYVLLFLAVMISWAGVPLVGSAALGAAAVGASQGNLNIAAVMIIATIAGEVGGIIGYRVGDRWGRQLIDRPGKRQASRQELMAKGERAYAKWGRLAVFFTPAIISGTAKMRQGQFIVWNFVASAGFALAVAPTAYGAGRVATGHNSTKDVIILIFGLAMSALLVMILVRRHRRHLVALATAGGPESSGP